MAEDSLRKNTAHSLLGEHRYIILPMVNLHTASRLEREGNQIRLFDGC